MLFSCLYALNMVMVFALVFLARVYNMPFCVHWYSFIGMFFFDLAFFDLMRFDFSSALTA